MNWFFVIVVAVLMVMVVVSLVRGVIAFMQSTKLDLERDEGTGASEMQLRQNKMMWARVKYQLAAILVVVVLLMMNR